MPVIALGPVTSLKNFVGRHAEEFAGEQQLPPEGFRIRTMTADERAPAILVVGNDSRGVLFGVGKLLRSLECRAIGSNCRRPLDVTTAPAMPIRGHQLGYRPEDEFVRRLGPGSMGAIHPRPGRVWLQRDRIDSAAVG